MRILLVRPPRPRKAITVGELMLCEPIGLEGLYGVLAPAHDVRIVDMMIDKAPLQAVCESWKPDAVGFTSLCIDVDNVLRLAREVKQRFPAVITLVGGTQTLLAPEAFFDDAIDHVFRFTNQQNIHLLFNALSQPDPIPMIDGICSRSQGFTGTAVTGRNAYLIPDRSATARYRQHYSYFGFKPCAIMQTSFGCSKRCRFCLRWRIEGGTEENQPLADVMDQIEGIEEPNIMVFDNDFLYSEKRIHAICDELEARSIKKTFLCYGSVHSIVNNREAVRRFAECGLSAVLVGYESFKDTELTTYEKKSTVASNFEAAAILKECGIDAWASFMMHPDWKRDDFREFRRFVRKLNPEVASCSPLTPFPTLPLYDEYKDRLLFSKSDHAQWNFGTVSIRPKNMGVRRYYWEILKTNLYINIYANSARYLMKKFGPTTLVRLTTGSLKLSIRYIRAMLAAKP